MKRLIIAIMVLSGFATQAQTVDWPDSLTAKLVDPISLSAILDVLANDLYFRGIYPDSTTLAGAETAADGYFAVADNNWFIANGSTWTRQTGGGGGGGAIGGLTDVAISGLATGHIIKSDNGSTFVNGFITDGNFASQTITGASIAGNTITTLNLSNASVTTGILADNTVNWSKTIDIQAFQILGRTPSSTGDVTPFTISGLPTNSVIASGDWILSTDGANGNALAKIDASALGGGGSGDETDRETNVTINGNTAYTNIITDETIVMNNAAAKTVTIAPNSSVATGIGRTVVIYNDGAGELEIVPGAGVSFKSPDSTAAGEYIVLFGDAVAVKKTDTDEHILIGTFKGQDGVGDWVNISLASPWVNNVTTLAYRRVVEAGQLSLEFKGDPSVDLVTPAVSDVITGTAITAADRPTSTTVFAVGSIDTATGTSAYGRILNTGTIEILTANGTNIDILTVIFNGTKVVIE